MRPGVHTATCMQQWLSAQKCRPDTAVRYEDTMMTIDAVQTESTRMPICTVCGLHIDRIDCCRTQDGGEDVVLQSVSIFALCPPVVQHVVIQSYL